MSDAEKQERVLYYALFEGEQGAEAALGEIFRKREGEKEWIEYDDAVVVVKNEHGKVKVRQTKDLSKGMGAMAGGAMGLLGGLLLTVPVLGLAAGATMGVMAAKKKGDSGMDDEFMDKLGKALYPGSSALVLLIPAEVQPELDRRLMRLNAETHATEVSEESFEKMKELVEEQQ